MYFKIFAGLFIFLLFPCFQSQDFKVISASMQSFESGREESGSGVHYRIRLVAMKNPNLIQFKHVWLKGEKYKPKLMNNEKEGFSKGDTLLLTFTVWEPGSEQEIKGSKLDTTHSVLPAKYESLNVIEWQKRKKIHFEALPEFNKLPARIYK